MVSGGKWWSLMLLYCIVLLYALTHLPRLSGDLLHHLQEAQVQTALLRQDWVRVLDPHVSASGQCDGDRWENQARPEHSHRRPLQQARAQGLGHVRDHPWEGLQQGPDGPSCEGAALDQPLQHQIPRSEPKQMLVAIVFKNLSFLYFQPYLTMS